MTSERETVTPSPDLLAVLREARKFVAQNATSERPLAGAYALLARIDSALRALTESAEAPVAWIPKCDLDEIAKGFVGRAFRDGSDNCAPVYTHPAPHPAVAGVTWEQASKADRIYWEHRDNGAIAEDAMRAALEAALGAREGK